MGAELNQRSASGNGCYVLARALAVLGAFGFAGGLLAVFVLLFGPKDAFDRPSPLALLLAYLIFALACFTGAVAAWIVEAIKRRIHINAQISRDQVPAERSPSRNLDDTRIAAQTLPQTSREQTQTLDRSDPNQTKASREASQNAVPANQSLPRTSSYPPQVIVSVTRKTEYVPGGKFKPGKLSELARQPFPAAPGKDTPSKLSRLPIQKNDKPTARTSPVNSTESKAGEPSPKCRHGRRLGYCALCNLDAYKKMNGSWEDD